MDYGISLEYEIGSACWQDGSITLKLYLTTIEAFQGTTKGAIIVSIINELWWKSFNYTTQCILKAKDFHHNERSACQDCIILYPSSETDKSQSSEKA